ARIWASSPGVARFIVSSRSGMVRPSDRESRWHSAATLRACSESFDKAETERMLVATTPSHAVSRVSQCFTDEPSLALRPCKETGNGSSRCDSRVGGLLCALAIFEPCLNKPDFLWAHDVC